MSNKVERLLAYVDKEGTYTLAALRLAISLKIGALVLQLTKEPTMKLCEELEVAKEDLNFVNSIDEKVDRIFN